MNKIIIKNMSISYGKRKILDSVDLVIDKPGIYGLVGENGSGKTTLLKLILGIISSAGVNSPGKDKISFLMGQNSYNRYLNVYDELKCHAYLRNTQKDKIDDIIKLCDLDKYADYKMKKLSYGNVQKVLIAKTLLEDADIYIYDEPLNGLDPKAIMMTRDIFLKLKDEGKIVIVSSHILKELEDTCDYIIFIKDGSLKFYNKKSLDNLEDLFI